MPRSASALQTPSPFYTATGVANAAANSNGFPLNATITQRVQVLITFTVGSLTNAIVQPQISIDGTNWFNATSPGALTMTATGRYAFGVNCEGAKLFRVQVTSTGTTTSSVISVDLAYQSQLIAN